MILEPGIRLTIYNEQFDLAQVHIMGYGKVLTGSVEFEARKRRIVGPLSFDTSIEIKKKTF